MNATTIPATAVIFPARETLREAIVEALQKRLSDPRARLYQNGRQLAWLPQSKPGWFLVAARDASPLDAYERIEKTAGCCDIEAAA